MDVEQIVDKLRFYTEELPKEALEEAIKQKDEITPKLIEMLEYAKENLEEIYNEKDNFFGYIYAFFLLAQFREKKAFPYIIDILKKDVDIVEYILGDDYPEYAARLLASTYNGDDEALFSIIENDKLDEFVRSTVLQTFAILYLDGKKDRDFMVKYFTKLLDNKREDDNSYLYAEIFDETRDLRLVELEKNIEKTFDAIDDVREVEELKKIFADEDYKINMHIFPFKNSYQYIDDVIGIMEEWQCFCYLEDEEYNNSKDFLLCNYAITERVAKYQKNNSVGRNDKCPCGNGKKYKHCCMNGTNEKLLADLNSIDRCVARAQWHLKRDEDKKSIRLLRMAWYTVQDICKENNVKTIEEYEQKYPGYDFLLNWLQGYEEVLDNRTEPHYLYDRLYLLKQIEETFVLDLYWLEKIIRARANTYFRLGNEEIATKIIEDYLVIRPDWGFGYIEMSDWYNWRRYDEHYDLEKAKEILLRAENVEGLRDKEIVFERLWDIYDTLGDKTNAKKYNEKMSEHNK